MLATILLASAAVSSAAPHQPSQPLAGYLAPEAIAERLAAVAREHATLASAVEIGRTAGGRPIVALRLGPAGVPALLLTAGLDGSHLVGPETALRVAERLVRDHADAFAGHALWIVPTVNPDALSRTLATPNSPSGRTLRPVDDDRDGAVDEDGPEDVDGDGVVSTMRIPEPALPFVATLVADGAEPRLLRAPDGAKGERARFRLVTEGIDNDGDGVLNEDGPGGVDLDRNFMHRWPEFGDGAGPYPLSESESLALALFVLAHPEIALSLVYGRHDNLAKPAEAKGNDVNPQIPLTIDAADTALYAEFAKLFKESTGQSRAASVDPAGSFFAWMYAQRGVPSLTTVVWGRPDPSEPPKPEGGGDGAGDAKPADAPAPPPAAPPPAAPPDAAPADGATPPAAPAAAPGGDRPAMGGEGRRRPRGGGPPGARGGARSAATASAAELPAGDLGEDTQWLRYSDRDRGGEGFVPWKPFDHPTLGKIEIGGFSPLFRVNPPVEALDALADKQSAFVVELLKRLPTWTIEGPTVEALAEGVHRVRLAIRNDGLLATSTAYGKRESIGEPFVVRLASPQEQGLSGRRVERVRGVEPGATQRFEWLVSGTPGDRIAIVVRPPGGPERTLEATLVAPSKEGSR